eukprot:Gb_32708 [translate_table: standard]
MSSLVYHVGIVFVIAWIASTFNFNSPVLYIIGFLYLYQVDRRYTSKIHKRIRHEERKHANQKRLLSYSETVRWLNHSIEKIWPICMERIASQEFLMPIIPWFLEKYKPWTAKKAVIQQLYLGRNPPVFTEIRALSQSADDDHLVLDLGLNFLSADDMSAVLAVQMRKRLGFGMWANLHVTGMHVEGKVRVGVKFLKEWPFLERVRVCFVDAPYFQMTVKPIFSHGLDVAELPGIAGWLDKLLAAAFEQSLVEPNMLVIDVERLLSSSQSSQSVSKSPGKWFYVDEKHAIAYVRLEIIEAADMKPSDPNGLADPFVKGCLGTYRFKTRIQKKTLNPKWQEEFRIPVSSWESPNLLVLNVRDKDHFVDDDLGDCTIHVCDLRGGQRHDKWIPLENIKMGRLHVAVTVLDVDTDKKMQDEEHIIDNQSSMQHEDENLRINESACLSSTTPELNMTAPMADEIEAINLQGNESNPVWIHHPGSDNSKSWEPRRGKLMHTDTVTSEESTRHGDSPLSTRSPRYPNKSDESSSEEEEESEDTGKGHRRRKLRKQLHRLRTVFRKDGGNEEISEVINVRGRKVSPEKLTVVGNKQSGVRIVFEDRLENLTGNLADKIHHPLKLHSDANDHINGQKTDVESPDKVKDMAKNILNKATKSAHNLTHVLSKKRSGIDKHNDAGDHSSFKESCGRDFNSGENSLGDGESAENKQECLQVGDTVRSQGSQMNLSLEKDDTISSFSSR